MIRAGLGAVMLAVFIVMNPVLLLSANTPSGGDMGAHVLVPAYLRDTLLPQGRILGWSNSWFGGFPVFYFYFPLPALVTVLLDVVLPYGVAFKLVTILGLLALPVATYFLLRAMRFARPGALVAAAAGGTFVFMESYSIYGGNIPSTLAGEYSFSWSFALALVYLGLLIKIVRDDRRLVPIAGVVLALTALTHLITTLAIIIASIPILLWKRGAKPVVATWVIGFAIAGFWAVPLLARIGYSADMAWVPLRDWKNVLPSELWWLLVPALFGLVWAIHRTPRIVPFVVLAVWPVIYYWLILLIPELLPDLGTWQDKLWNGRFLPFFYFGVFVFAGLAVGQGIRELARRQRRSGGFVG
ncbi:MAG: 6-pyruvoyl-tetrahydropterin synthase-related protein [Acidimicrobiia bacterium]|nr:6-pyruvoyl-tetrahydropterin synthase-related protein [Acidimicrobiia bacterium]